jgi:hypothetical protein
VDKKIRKDLKEILWGGMGSEKILVESYVKCWGSS